MKKVLILFAHPKFEKSRANARLLDRITGKVGVTLHDLYEEYPNFHINVQREQELLLQHDLIIWHHPFYWYSSPALLKQWFDLVLEFNWAYGPNGRYLQDKICMNVITTGGSREVYCSEGYNSFTINQFLRPFEQTAKLCGMTYMLPFAVMGTHNLSDTDLNTYADQYERLIDVLQSEVTLTDTEGYSFFNDVPILQTV